MVVIARAFYRDSEADGKARVPTQRGTNAAAPGIGAGCVLVGACRCFLPERTLLPRPFVRPFRLQHARNLPSSVYAIALMALGAPLLAACSAETEADQPQRASERVGRTIQPVIAGSPSGTSHDAVVAFARFEAGVRRSLCTATMIAPNLVLTARHCVSNVSGGAGCGPDGTAVVGAALQGDAAAANLAVFVAPNGAAPDTTSVETASARGKALVVDTSASTICNRDIALVVLDKALANPIAKLRFGAPKEEDKLTVVGFGVTETGVLAPERLERSNVSWLGVGPKLYPESTTYGLGTAELMVGESVCAGDSGGPLLGSTGAVIGVASRVGNGTARDPSNMASTCVGDATHAVYSQLGAHEPLVTRAFEIAGQRPWIDGQRNPLDPAAATYEATMTPDHPAKASTSSDLDESGGGQELTSATVDGATEADAGGGCTASPSSPKDAVNEALGATAVLLLVFRFGRRSQKKSVVSHR